MEVGQTMQAKGTDWYGASERGVALLTVMIIMLMMTVLGIAAFTVSGLENRMSGFVTTKEAAAMAAESCEGAAANIIKQTVLHGQIPAGFLDSANPPGPIPAANANILLSEIRGSELPSPAPANTVAENYGDSALAVPNLVLTNIPGYTVRGDIDRLFGLQPDAVYTNVSFRITCTATNMATGSQSTTTSVYKCAFDGQSCVEK